MSRSHLQEAERNRRLAIVLERLQVGDLVPSYQLARLAGVQIRTIHRYVDILRKQGVPIGGCKGHGGGVILLKKKVPIAIQRIIEEVTVNQPVGGYNRTYHRHNR